MTKQPEGGVPGDAQLRSYTYWLYFAAMFGVYAYIKHDLDTHRRLCVAFGFESNAWVWIAFVVLQFATLMAAVGPVVAAYRRYTGLEYVQDRIGYAKSGGSDITAWCSLAALAGTLLVFAALVPQGALGWFRVCAVALSSIFLTRVLARAAASAVFGALYGPARQRGRFKDTCQETYPTGDRCGFGKYKEERYCRWHLILHQFRADLEKRPKVGRGFMFATGACLVAAGGLAWQAPEFGAVPLILGILFLGTACKLFADAVISMDYPFSQFAFWAILLAVGMVVEVVCGLVGAVLLCSQPSAVQPFLQKILNQPQAIPLGPPLLAMSLVALAVVSTKMLMHRIFFTQHGFLSMATVFVSVSFAFWAFEPQLRGAGLIRAPQQNQQFWQAAVGDKLWVLFIPWVIGFNLCEVINLRLRGRGLTEDGFRATVWPSFPVCAGTPLVAMLASRYAVVWLNQSGAILFSALAVGLCIPLCVWGTWVVIRGQRARERAATAESPDTTRRVAAPAPSPPPRTPRVRHPIGLGQIIVSRHAARAITPQEVQVALMLHEHALQSDGQLISCHDAAKRAFVIITHPDRGITAVLLSDELDQV